MDFLNTLTYMYAHFPYIYQQNISFIIVQKNFKQKKKKKKNGIGNM